MSGPKVTNEQADVEVMLAVARRALGESHPVVARVARSLHPSASVALEPVAAPTPLVSTSAIEAAFDRFWAIYPIKQGKGAARTAWTKAVRKVSIHTIIDAAEAYRDFLAGETEFVKHPATWLNQECWADELVAQAPRDRVAANRQALVAGVVNRPNRSFAERMADAAGPHAVGAG